MWPFTGGKPGQYVGWFLGRGGGGRTFADAEAHVGPVNRVDGRRGKGRHGVGLGVRASRLKVRLGVSDWTRRGSRFVWWVGQQEESRATADNGIVEHGKEGTASREDTFFLCLLAVRLPLRASLWGYVLDGLTNPSLRWSDVWPEIEWHHAVSWGSRGVTCIRARGAPPELDLGNNQWCG